MHRRSFLALAGLVVPAAALAQASETPEALVRALYAAHLPDGRTDEPGVLSTPELRARFLTPELAAAIQRSEERSQQAGEILEDTLDFDPVTDSQDPEVRDLTARQLSADADRALVAVTFSRGENRRVELRYVLARADNGPWRVHDIVKPEAPGEEGWSVRQILGLPN